MVIPANEMFVFFIRGARVSVCSDAPFPVEVQILPFILETVSVWQWLLRDRDSGEVFVTQEWLRRERVLLKYNNAAIVRCIEETRREVPA